MTLRTRRIIYIIFIFLFFVITPAVILYTAGYRYNFQKNKIQKTGIFILKSKPEEARIYLNNKIRKKTTPARIANLLPGDYLIKIEKDGYYSWEKTLPVFSRLTTFAENVFLFKKSLPAKIMDGEIDTFLLSPDKQKIVYLQTIDTGKEIWLLKLKTSKKFLLYRLSEKLNQNLKLEWGADGQKLLISSGDKVPEDSKYIVLDAETQEASVYQNLEEFYFEFKGINNKLAAAGELPNLIFIPNVPERFFAVLDQKNQNFVVRDSDSGSIVFQTKAASAAWLPGTNKILYIKDFELWIYDLNADQENLITRYSREIKKALWLSDNYILILLDNTLKIIELDERDRRNVIDFVSLESIDNFDLDAVGQKIYFTGVIGNKKGVYELEY
jgi:hypothetical protein